MRAPTSWRVMDAIAFTERAERWEEFLRWAGAAGLRRAERRSTRSWGREAEATVTRAASMGVRAAMGLPFAG